MPAGASGVSPAASARWPAAWIRLSTSRIFSRYSSTVERSCGASSLFKRLAAAITESRMLALALEAGGAFLGRSDVAEHSLEYALRVHLLRQRRRRRLPGQRVQIDAAPAELARVRRAVDVLDAELERAQRRVAPDRVGDVLIDRLTGVARLRPASVSRNRRSTTATRSHGVRTDPGARIPVTMLMCSRNGANRSSSGGSSSLPADGGVQISGRTPFGT